MMTTSGMDLPSTRTMSINDNRKDKNKDKDKNEEKSESEQDIHLRQGFSLSWSIGSRSRLSLCAHSAHLPNHHDREQVLEITLEVWNFVL